MSGAFRTKVIKTLVDEISALTGGRFEQFGYRLMDFVYPAQWIEGGTTIDGAPRGYAADTSAQGGELVTEMSSEADYFEERGKKIDRDVKHALKLHPSIKKLWLLSSRQASAGETTSLSNREQEIRQQNPKIDEVSIMDARRIAGWICDLLTNEKFVRDVSSYLPSVQQLSDQNAFQYRVPVVDFYQPRNELEELIRRKLTTDQVVSVRGISGIGKSAVVGRVVELERDSFDSVIWFDARDLQNAGDLSSLDVLRSGRPHNIHGFLRRHRCLLVLDDCSLPATQFEALGVGESKIVLVSQVRDEAAVVTVGEVDREVAKKLLESRAADPCPAAIFERVFECVGGYPLLLASLGGLAAVDGWPAVEQCCEDSPASMEDDTHAKVWQRILQRHSTSLKEELAFFRWLDDSRVDAQLLQECVSFGAARYLEKRCFLAASSARQVRLHDVVFQSIKIGIELHPRLEKAFEERLALYVSAAIRDERNDLSRVARTHFRFFKRLLERERRPALVYALALVRRAECSPELLLGDVRAESDALAALPDWSEREVDVRAVIEAIEATYTIQVSAGQKDKAQAYLQENLPALDALRSGAAATGCIGRDLHHHYAKMLVRLQRREETRQVFDALLSADETFAAARLQVARLDQRDKKFLLARDHAAKIIAQSEAPDGDRVSSEILLQALLLLVESGTQEEIVGSEETMLRAVGRVRDAESHQAVRLVATLSKKLWYTHPTIVEQLFLAVEWSDVLPHEDREKFEWAEAHKHAAKRLKKGDSTRQILLEEAAWMYSNMGHPDPFQMVQIADALILLSRGEEALKLLSQVPVERQNAFWFHRQAQAFRTTGDARSALAVIQRALDENNDAKYRPTFLEERFKVRRILEDENAADDLKEAIACLPVEDRYRQQLEEELAALSVGN